MTLNSTRGRHLITDAVRGHLLHIRPTVKVLMQEILSFMILQSFLSIWIFISTDFCDSTQNKVRSNMAPVAMAEPEPPQNKVHITSFKNKQCFLQTEVKLNTFQCYRVYSDSVSSSTLPSSSFSQNSSCSSGSGWADTRLDPSLSLTPPGWWRCRLAQRRSRSVPASSSVCWTLAADRPRPPPGSADTVYRSGTGRSTDRQHSHRTAHSWTSLELEETGRKFRPWWYQKKKKKKDNTAIPQAATRGCPHRWVNPH